MRYLIVLIVYALLGNPIDVLASDSPATSDGCDKSELVIVGKKEGKDFRFKMGESLRIKATGGCVAFIKRGLDKAEASNALKL